MTSSAAPVVVLIGPSGSGKSSVARSLSDRGLIRVHPTWTTRPRRSDEARGSVEHRFVTDEKFDRLARDGAFLDTVTLFGLPYRYGLPPIRRSTDGRVDAVMLRAPLVERFRAAVGDTFVIQIEDDPDRVAERLRRRGGSVEDLRARLVDNERELVAGRALADQVFHNDATLGVLVERVAAAVVTRMAHVWNQGPAMGPPPDARLSSGFFRTFVIVVGVILILGGLAVVGVIVLFLVAMNSWSSNK